MRFEPAAGCAGAARRGVELDGVALEQRLGRRELHRGVGADDQIAEQARPGLVGARGGDGQRGRLRRRRRLENCARLEEEVGGGGDVALCALEQPLRRRAVDVGDRAEELEAIVGRGDGRHGANLELAPRSDLAGFATTPNNAMPTTAPTSAMLRVFALLLFVQSAAPAKKKSSLAKNSAPSLSSALAKGDELRQAGALDEAEAVYAAAAKLHPTRSEPLFFLGMTARAGGRTDEAMAQYKATLRLAPQTAEAHMNLASVLSTLDDRDAEALLHYEQALALREWPEKLAAQAEYNSAISLSGLDRADEAAAAARRALELAPEFDQAAELIEQLEEEAGGALGDGSGGGGGGGAPPQRTAWGDVDDEDEDEPPPPPPPPPKPAKPAPSLARRRRRKRRRRGWRGSRTTAATTRRRLRSSRRRRRHSRPPTPTSTPRTAAGAPRRRRRAAS